MMSTASSELKPYGACTATSTTAGPPPSTTPVLSRGLSQPRGLRVCRRSCSRPPDSLVCRETQALRSDSEHAENDTLAGNEA